MNNRRCSGMKNTFIRLIICVLLITPFPHTAAAQSSSNITTNEAIVNFPQGITFHLLAKSDEVIQSVVLRYGTNGRSCQEGEAEGAGLCADADGYGGTAAGVAGESVTRFFIRSAALRPAGGERRGMPGRCRRTDPPPSRTASPAGCCSE